MNTYAEQCPRALTISFYCAKKFHGTYTKRREDVFTRFFFMFTRTYTNEFHMHLLLMTCFQIW